MKRNGLDKGVQIKEKIRTNWNKLGHQQKLYYFLLGTNVLLQTFDVLTTLTGFEISKFSTVHAVEANYSTALLLQQSLLKALSVKALFGVGAITLYMEGTRHVVSSAWGKQADQALLQIYNRLLVAESGGMVGLLALNAKALIEIIGGMK